MGAQRTARWRREHGLQNDADFAFAFHSFEALITGGRDLANSWVRVRSAQESELLPAAADVVEGKSRGTAVHLPFRPLAPRPSRAPAVRLRAVQDEPEQLRREWRSCTRLAQRLVTEAERATVLNALRTWGEVITFMQARSRRLPPEVADLDVFLHEGTAAPARATQSLRWLTKQARVDLGLGMLAPPAGQARRAGPRGQAAVVEPVILLKMEQRMEELYTQGDDRWQALLAAWMLYGGVLRHNRLTRAEVRKVTMSTIHAHCSKGKQRRLRKGFDFCVPGQLSTGTGRRPGSMTLPWCRRSRRQTAGWRSVGRGSRGRCLMRYRMVRHEFADLVENPAMVSSYSFRRVGTTVGQLVGFSALDMAALGDWQTEGDVSEDARMPLHYSGAKYVASLLAKRRMVGAVAALTHHESWELAAQAGQAASAQAKARDA